MGLSPKYNPIVAACDMKNSDGSTKPGTVFGAGDTEAEAAANAQNNIDHRSSGLSGQGITAANCKYKNVPPTP